jgi:hypothetical protein
MVARGKVEVNLLPKLLAFYPLFGDLTSSINLKHQVCHFMPGFSQTKSNQDFPITNGQSLIEIQHVNGPTFGGFTTDVRDVGKNQNSQPLDSRIKVSEHFNKQ